jgi:probable metal-binding protein
MNKSYHGHEVMQLMMASGETLTEESYTAALATRFGTDATFFSCSTDGMTPLELLTFFRERGKIVEVEGGFRFGTCGHGNGHGHGGGCGH